MLNIVFMGTPDFAKESLEAIYNEGHKILAVVTNPDRPKGRKMKMMPTPVKEFAIEKNLKIYQPEKVRKNTEFIEEIKDLNPDVICVVAYGKILPKEILEIPKLGCINVHGSLLPKYRGAAPIQWAVINGEKTTGITTMYMDIGMDTGDMILKEETEIGEEETTGELWQRLSSMGAKLLVQTLKQIEEGTAPREKQGEDFSIAPMLNKEMSEIKWNKQTSSQIHNLVRGLNPIMGTYSYNLGEKIKFWKVQISSYEEMQNIDEEVKKEIDTVKKLEPGTVIISNPKKGLYIKTIDGSIKVLEIQGENAKRMSISDFLRGKKIEVGTKFEELE